MKRHCSDLRKCSEGPIFAVYQTVVSVSTYKALFFAAIQEMLNTVTFIRASCETCSRIKMWLLRET